MKSISFKRFKMYSDMGAVQEAYFPLGLRAWVRVEGRKYHVRGVTRRDLAEWLNE